MIERRRKARPPVQNGEAYDPIADMSSVGIVKTACDSLHSEYLLVKSCYPIVVLSIESEMSNFSGHGFSFLQERMLLRS